LWRWGTQPAINQTPDASTGPAKAYAAFPAISVHRWRLAPDGGSFLRPIEVSELNSRAAVPIDKAIKGANTLVIGRSGGEPVKLLAVFGREAIE